MKHFSSFITLLSLYAINGAAATYAADKPNIIFLLIDDWGWQDAGFMGSKYYDTPAMDALALDGIRFNDAYSSAPNCAPTRAALMSGQYAPRTGIYTVGTPERGNAQERRLIPIANSGVLDMSFVTMAESIKAAGYNTAFMGKWHLGAGETGGPLTQGYDINIGGNHTGSPRGGHFSPYENETLMDGPDDEYLTDRLTDEAISFINTQSASKPFYLQLSHYAVHTPIQAPERTIKKYNNRTADEYNNNPTYGAMVDHVDQSISRIMTALSEKGFDKNTVVILTSDNGGYGPATQAPDLRGAKGMPYEGGNRVPMVIRMPDNQGSGRLIKEPVNSVDFYPTLIELAGGSMPSNQIADGKSLVPLLEDENGFERDAIFFHFPAYLQPYVGSTTWRATPYGSIRMERFKLIEFFEFGQLELYDLDQDLKETTNIALDKPEITAKLYKRMLEWREETDAPVPTLLNVEYDPNFAPDGYITWSDVEAKLVDR